MSRRSAYYLSKDFLSGVLFVASGAATQLLSLDLAVGTASRMGPGFFPAMLAWGLVGIGVVLIVRSVLAGARDPVERGRWKPLLCVTGAVVLFGLLIETAGLVIAVIVLICCSALGGPDFRRKEVVVLAVGAAVFAWIVFVLALSLHIPVWPL